MVVKLGLEKCFQLCDDEFYFSYEAMDFYYCYKEDIVLMVEMGFKVFCILIVWSCFFLQGDELMFNQQGIVFYCFVFEECKKYGIELLVMLCYFDVLMYLVVEYGLWCNCKMVEFFICYVCICFEVFDGLVKYWFIFNEINIMLYSFFFGVGLVFEDGENQDQVKYQVVYYEFIVSVLVIKIVYEVNL